MRRIFRACVFSWQGLVTTFRDEAAFRQICLLAAVLFPAACFLAGSWTEWVLLILPVMLCLIVELLNSGIENCIDRISPEIHPLSKKAKDQGSAAQFLSQVFLVLVWASFLLRRVLE